MSGGISAQRASNAILYWFLLTRTNWLTNNWVDDLRRYEANVTPMLCKDMGPGRGIIIEYYVSLQIHFNPSGADAGFGGGVGGGGGLGQKHICWSADSLRHHRPWYWLFRVNRSLSSIRRHFYDTMGAISLVGKWKKMQIWFYFSSNLGHKICVLDQVIQLPYVILINSTDSRHWSYLQLGYCQFMSRSY